MIDKYRILNNEKMDFNKYNTNIETDNEKMKNIMISKLNIRKNKKRSPLKIAMTSVASILLCVTTIYAGQYISSRINVNDKQLPELDDMRLVSINEIKATPNKDGFIEKKYNSYNDLSKELGISLLNSDLAIETPYMRVNALTSISRDYAMITVDNYIIGDTSNFRLVADLDRYNYDHGEKYYSPISLKIDMILSKDQLSTGFDVDYLGMYEFQESYISTNGYKVNIITSTEEERSNDDSVVSEKCAVFVADGIRYTLKGRVSTELLKDIVDSMK